jgi:acyl-CoA thioesterase
MTAPPSDAQLLAERATAAMCAHDRAAQSLGIDIVAVGPGSATLAMVVRDDMMNGQGSAHGGFIFTLADCAFAYACNSAGNSTVAAHCAITFIRPGRRGDRLVAVAREVSRAGRSGIYDVQVSAEGTVIAEFRGHSRTVGGSFVDPPAP